MLIWYFSNNLDLYYYGGKLPEQHFSVWFFSNPGEIFLFFLKFIEARISEWNLYTKYKLKTLKLKEINCCMLLYNSLNLDFSHTWFLILFRISCLISIWLLPDNQAAARFYFGGCLIDQAVKLVVIQ